MVVANSDEYYSNREKLMREVEKGIPLSKRSFTSGQMNTWNEVNYAFKGTSFIVNKAPDKK